MCPWPGAGARHQLPYQCGGCVSVVVVGGCVYISVADCDVLVIVCECRLSGDVCIPL
jgi:hypothetical protein